MDTIHSCFVGLNYDPCHAFLIVVLNIAMIDVFMLYAIAKPISITNTVNELWSPYNYASISNEWYDIYTCIYVYIILF